MEFNDIYINYKYVLNYTIIQRNIRSYNDKCFKYLQLIMPEKNNITNLGNILLTFFLLEKLISFGTS